MMLIPAFEIAIWNAWLFWALQFAAMIIPELLMDEEAKAGRRRAASFVPFKKRSTKIIALSTHLIIIPFSIVYSVFLPLRIGTAWFYAGLVILAAALVMGILAALSFAAARADQPVTGGVYRISRHPIYLSGFLFQLSIAVACASWVMFLLAAAWIICFTIAVPEEESFLAERYGDAYRDYIKRSPRWIGFPGKVKA
jgi:protein-S-isoprenylcysteine O-methyltransferase Ste14